MGLLDFLFKKSKDTSVTNDDLVDNTSFIEDYDECSECEQLAIASRASFLMGDRECANDMALEVYESIVNDPSQIQELKNVSTVALALGALMEGEVFSDGDSIKRAVGLTYYLLSRAIKESQTPDPYLYVYRFSTVWEYNKTFYHLFANAEGTEYDFSPFDIMSQVSTMTYNHHMAGMQKADALSEPKVLQLDPALRNLFYETYEQYRNTPSEQIISLGNQYHEQVYTYLTDKIRREDLDF